MQHFSARRARALAHFQHIQMHGRDAFEAKAAEHATDLLLNFGRRAGPYAVRAARRNARSIVSVQQRRQPALVHLDAGRPSSESDDSSPAQTIDVPDPSPNPERALIYKSDVAYLAKNLSPLTREVLACWRDGLTVEETAMAVSKSVGRVKQLRRDIIAVAKALLTPPSDI